MVENIDIEIECYECGELQIIPFRLFAGKGEYVYCDSCKQGMEIRFNGETLSFKVLTYEG